MVFNPHKKYWWHLYNYGLYMFIFQVTFMLNSIKIGFPPQCSHSNGWVLPWLWRWWPSPKWRQGGLDIFFVQDKCVYICMYVCIYIDIPHDAVHHGWVMLGWFWPAKQLEDLQVQKPLYRRSLQVQTSSCTSINGVVWEIIAAHPCFCTLNYGFNSKYPLDFVTGYVSFKMFQLG